MMFFWDDCDDLKSAAIYRDTRNDEVDWSQHDGNL